MEKKRYEIVVAGCQLAIITDEREEFVNSIVETIDKEIRDVTAATKRSSNLDAAILCAIEYYSEKVKAEKRARNLEAQISLYDANLRRFREENLALREKLESLGVKADVEVAKAEIVDIPKEAKEAKETKEAKEAKPKAAPKKEAKAAPAEEKPTQMALEGAEKEAPKDDARAARLRAIEELLGRGKN